MSEVSWSASLRLAVFVAGEPQDEVESVVLLRAPEGGWDAAFERALALGRGMERRYVNGDGHEVTWFLGAVQTLDQLGAEVADGLEVFFKVRAADAALTPTDLRPRRLVRPRAGSRRSPGPVFRNDP
jgi:hypothetical protein